MLNNLMNTDKNSDNDNAESQDENVVNEGIGPLTTERLADILRRDFDPSEQGQTDTAESDSNQAEDYEGDGEPQATETEDSEEVHSQDEEDGEDRGLSKGVKKRIDKLVSKRREAEAEITKLKEELETARNQKTASDAVIPIKDSPYSHVNSVAEIESEVSQARSVRRWCEEHSDGYTVTGADGNETYYSPEEVKQIKLNAIDALEEHLPKRMQYIRAKDNFENLAEKEYGVVWKKDVDTREKQIALQFLKAFPEITRFPDYKMVIGDYIAGVKAREGKSSKTVAKAPHNPRPSGSAPKSNSMSKLKESENRYKANGNNDDLKDILLKKFL
jgi:hypothetical protein